MNGNTKQALMHKIQMYAFTAHECALYLDCHPNNRNALKKYSEAVKMLNETVSTYEGLYGELSQNRLTAENGWNWVKGTWPWQNNDSEAQR